MVLLEPLSYQPVSGGPLLFLAGPISGAPHWQAEAFDLILGLESGAVVASPRPLPTSRYGRYRPTEALRSFHRQRAWERHYMDIAALQGCVLFWLPAPQASVKGRPYAATTRFELGLRTARWARDQSLGLCVGGDPGFPTFGTLAYDLEKEMPGRTLHRTLAETVREAVGIANANYDRWTRTGSPQVPLEASLVSMSHEERCLAAAVMARLPGNPINHPEALRREALRLLKAAPDLSSQDATDSLDFEELEELEDAEELEELETVGEPENPTRPRADPRGEAMRGGMRATGSWFLAGKLVNGPKYLAVGRSDYYISFLQRLAVELGAPVYQSDYMEWTDPGNPHASLAFYLETAERIDVNLEGISPDELRAATADSGGLAEGRPNRLPHMTSWEINRIYHAGADVPVFWHTGGSMGPDQAFAILGAKVPREFIVED